VVDQFRNNESKRCSRLGILILRERRASVAGASGLKPKTITSDRKFADSRERLSFHFHQSEIFDLPR
jgi:hypothetical protein